MRNNSKESAVDISSHKTNFTRQFGALNINSFVKALIKKKQTAHEKYLLLQENFGCAGIMLRKNFIDKTFVEYDEKKKIKPDFKR